MSVDDHHREELAIWACTAGRRFPTLQSKIRALLADANATEANFADMIVEVNRSGGAVIGGSTNPTKDRSRPATVNDRMAEILNNDPNALWWTAKEWAVKLGMSTSTVTLSETWMATIKYARDMLRTNRPAR